MKHDDVLDLKDGRYVRRQTPWGTSALRRFEWRRDWLRLTMRPAVRAIYWRRMRRIARWVAQDDAG